MKTQTKSHARKMAQRDALRDRLARAQAAIYGNARTPYGDDVPGFTSFYDWLGDYAERERDYMTVENFGMTESETQSARILGFGFWKPARERLANARAKYPTPRYPTQVRDAAHANHAFPAGDWERAHAVLILDARERLTQPRRNGKPGREPTVYSYGRNGKTVYPESFATHRNNFTIRDLSENNAEELTRACQFIEQFNAYVRSVAKDARNVYRDEARDALHETITECHFSMRTARADYHKLATELRTLRGTVVPTACDILRGRLHTLADSVARNARIIADTRATLRGMPA
jgi:hypothetical protein